MDNTKTIKMNRELDALQEGNDFSFVEAQAKGKDLTAEQQAAKDRTKNMLDHLENPEVDARIRAMLG